jgi:SAM-dependent methyltransferase
MSQAGEVGPDTYAVWRASTLGAITERLEQALVIELVGPLAGKSVLDAGCGDGTLAVEFLRRGASTAVGCDPDRRMIARASGRMAAGGNRMLVLPGRVEHLPFRDESFDVVTAITVLCFLDQRDAAVKEMARVLKPGGRIVIGALGRWSPWAASRRIRGWLGNEFWKKARFSTARELATLASGAALRVEQIRGAIYYPAIGRAARAMEALDPRLGRATIVGAAFIAMLASKRA